MRINEWFDKNSFSDHLCNPVEPDISNISRIWMETAYDLAIFSLHRNASFFKWRYLNSKGFKYLFF